MHIVVAIVGCVVVLLLIIIIILIVVGLVRKNKRKKFSTSNGMGVPANAACSNPVYYNNQSKFVMASTGLTKLDIYSQAK